MRGAVLAEDVEGYLFPATYEVSLNCSTSSVFIMMTKAFLELKQDSYVIKYTEEEEDGSKSETTLQVENKKRITVSREGTISTHMIIEEGVRNLSHHVTPYGAFSMGVVADKIEYNVKAEEIKTVAENIREIILGL